MKLSQFLSKLTTTNVQVTLVDMETDATIADMKASGYTALDDTIENREVMQWSLISATHVKIVLGDTVSA